MVEIERKFLVDTKKWQPKGIGTAIKQGYLSVDENRVVRVRIAGDYAYITIKGKTTGISRAEFEYEVPKNDALILLRMCLNEPVEKTRYTEFFENMLWEIDVFEGANNGLVMAEVELNNENQTVVLPEWVSEEVSTDKRYFNAYLSVNPFVRR
ncbi:MAG TPA: adenylate cyclase [Prolixibacteraceae bacterium]|nr:adenylate cyclase [Prolixibacteraceae bacterium]